MEGVHAGSYSLKNHLKSKGTEKYVEIRNY